MTPKQVKLWQGGILLASIAALGVVLFGHDDALTVSLLVIVGLAWFWHQKIF